MKFLHTADWQIGMKAVHVGYAAQRVRDERFAAAERVVTVAKDNHVDFILLAGDTFEDNGVPRVTIQRIADILNSAGVPIYVIPGNHDPSVPGSVWEHPAWEAAPNITVILKEEPIQIQGGTLFPCPVFEKYSSRDPTDWINGSEIKGISVGIAHGTVEGIHQEEPEYPIPRDAAERRGLDYLALGHWHSVTTYEDDEGAIRMAYSGTHEPTRFGERDSGNVLIVEIPDDGGHPVVTRITSRGLEWLMIEEKILQSKEFQNLRKRIEGIKNPDSALLDLHVQGLLAAADWGEVLQLQEIVESRFLFGRVELSLLRPSPDDESWVSTLPAGILRQAGTRLKELSDPGYPGERPPGATPEVAARALMEMYAIVTETKK